MSGSTRPELYTFPSPAMDAPTRLHAASGEAVVFGAPSPDKTTPNEDSAAVFALANSATVMVVADGVGGARDGQLASATVIESLKSTLVAAESGELGLRAAVLTGLDNANASILARGIGAATTVVVAVVIDDTLRVFHVGDSALLQVGQRGRVIQQTVAHSPVGFAEAAGMLTEEEALHHAERHYVSNTLGSPEMRIEMGPTVALKRRDTVVLASDGLFDNLRVDEIVERVRAGKLLAAGERLKGKARERMISADQDEPSKPDDLTFVLYRRSS